MPAKTSEDHGESPYTAKPSSAHRDRMVARAKQAAEEKQRPRSGAKVRSRPSTANGSDQVNGKQNGHVSSKDSNGQDGEVQNDGGQTKSSENGNENNIDEQASDKQGTEVTAQKTQDHEGRSLRSASDESSSNKSDKSNPRDKSSKDSAAKKRPSGQRDEKHSVTAKPPSGQKDKNDHVTAKPPSGQGDTKNNVAAKSPQKDKRQDISRKSSNSSVSSSKTGTNDSYRLHSGKSNSTIDSEKSLARIKSGRRRNNSGSSSHSLKYDIGPNAGQKRPKPANKHKEETTVEEQESKTSKQKDASNSKHSKKSGSEKAQENNEISSQTDTQQNKEQQNSPGETRKDSASLEQDTDPSAEQTPKEDQGSQTNQSSKEDTGTQMKKQRTETKKEERKVDDELNSEASSTKRRRKKAPPEIKAVSKIVSGKLEDYFNFQKRQLRFNPEGVFRTNHKMAKYDLAYKILEHTVFDKDPAREKSANRELISPRLVPNSRRVTTSTEASRLVSYAREVMGSAPVQELSTLHRYRPYCRTERSADTGIVQNYKLHPGTALHTQNYVCYYTKEGLHSGNPEKSERFRRLKMKKEEEAENDAASVEGHENRQKKPTAKSSSTKPTQAPSGQPTGQRAHRIPSAPLSPTTRLRCRSSKRRPPSSSWVTPSGAPIINVRDDDDYTNDFESISGSLDSLRSDVSIDGSSHGSRGASGRPLMSPVSQSTSQRPKSGSEPQSISEKSSPRSKSRSPRSKSRSPRSRSRSSKSRSKSPSTRSKSRSPRSASRSCSPASKSRSHGSPSPKSGPRTPISRRRSSSTLKSRSRSRSGSRVSRTRTDSPTSYNYSDDFEEESPREESTSKSGRETDSVSVRTYASLEHAVDMGKA